MVVLLMALRNRAGVDSSVIARKSKTFLLGAVAAIGLLSPLPAAADGYYQPSEILGADSESADVAKLRLAINKSRVVKLSQSYAEALIGNDKIADVMPMTDRSIYILGKSVGTTSLAILDTEKQVKAVIDIEVTPNISGLRDKLRENLPHEKIRVTSANGRVLLSGEVRDSGAANMAVTIAEQYAPGAVTNAMAVRASQQVMLEVRFVEASRTASRELGVGWRGRNLTSRGKTYDFNTGPQASVASATGVLTTAAALSGAQPFGTLIANLLDNGKSADVIIQALEERGLARRLAEPNLIAMSGDTASFLAGGEFPFPVSSEDGKITVEFKQFGVALGFTPTVLDRERINLKIIPEVSEIDNSIVVESNDLRIPGLVVRRASTTVELRDGQSFAIAGLIQITHTKDREQLPWLGQVPVLGALFRSAQFSKKETDLVIIVTPRLVKPKAPGEQLVTPFDRMAAGNDKDFFLGGRDEVKRTYNGYIGHIIDLKARPEHVSYK